MGRNGKGKGRRLYTKKYSYVNLSWPGLPVVYLPCPHQHFKTPTIDRKSIDRDQHINLLSTPKGYRWDNPQDNNKKQMACKPPKKKFLCVESSGNSNNKQCKSSMDDIWKCMTPELMEKLINLFVNDFHMSRNEAKEFICEQNDTNKTMQKMSVCPCPCASGDTANQNLWMKEFSELIACKLRNQLALVLCGRRNRRQKLLMELVVNFMSDISGECINISCPETRMQRMMVYAADRIALWLDRMMEESDKKMAEDEAAELEEKKRRDEERRRLEEERLRREQEERDRLERERLERERAEAEAAVEVEPEEAPPPEEAPEEEEVPPPAEEPPPPPPEEAPAEEPAPVEEPPPEAAMVGAGEGELGEAEAEVVEAEPPPEEAPEEEKIEVEEVEEVEPEEEPVEEVVEEEAPPEEVEEVEPEELPIEVEPEVEVKAMEPMDVIVDWIKETEYDKTERQEKISGIVKSRLLSTLKDQKDVEGMAAAIDFLGNQVSTWIDKLASEAEKEIRPLIKPKNARFMAPKGVLYHVKRGSDNYYKVRQVSCTELEAKKEKFDKPMSSDDVKKFTKWAEGLIKVSDSWTRWVENAFCEAYTIYNRNADQPSELSTAEFKCWRDSKRKEAIEWKRTQKAIFNKAKMWENWAQFTKKEFMGRPSAVTARPSAVKESEPTLQE